MVRPLLLSGTSEALCPGEEPVDQGLIKDIYFLYI